VQLLFLVIVSVMVAPLLLVVAISFTEESRLVSGGYRFIPPEYSTRAYQLLFAVPTVLIRAYGVTIRVTVLGTIGSLFLVSITGYVISRRTFPLRNAITFIIFFTVLFGGGLIPSYILITQYLGLRNRLLVLILPMMFNPFLVLIMKGYLSSIPEAIIDAAYMDGAGEFRIYRSVVLPTITPALATVAVIVSFAYWNDWWLGLLYIDDPNLTPLQLLLWRMHNRVEYLASNPEVQMMLQITDLPTLSLRMAMVVVAAGPMMFVFPFFQKYFVKGITFGSLKD
jgi:putative aldouronate transport system permease protein